MAAMMQMKKFDIAALVPNSVAVSTSRTKPSTRLSDVNAPTVNADRMTLCCSTVRHHVTPLPTGQLQSAIAFGKGAPFYALEFRPAVI